MHGEQGLGFADDLNEEEIRERTVFHLLIGHEKLSSTV